MIVWLTIEQAQGGVLHDLLDSPEARLHSLVLGALDRGQAYERVLGQAFTDAHAKAARLAELSGARLGAVQEVTENGAAARAGHHAMAASSGPGPSPGGARIEGGRHELTTSVTVTWLLEDA